MAINSSTNPWVVNNSTSINDIYDGQRYYAERDHRYRQEMERERQRMYNSMQNTAVYNPNAQSQQGVTDLQREQKAAQKAKADDRFTSNKNLLLLEN